MRNYFIILFLILRLICFSQKDDSLVSIDTTHTLNKKATYSKARRAAILSACLPGLGQAYNKKYYKIPIIYAGLGGFGYLFVKNNMQYNNYKNALILSQDTAVNKGYYSVDGIKYSTTQLQTQKLYYKKFRDLGVIGMGIIYLLNIIDANVDGHLQTFDVSDNLSLHLQPWQKNISTASTNKMVYGLSLTLNFK